MPELPEVETTRRGVAPHVVGRHVAELHVYDRRLRWPVPADLQRRIRGRTIDAVERRSKYLLFRMGADTLLMHFGMTGSLRVYRAPPARRPHDHIDLVLADAIAKGGSTLRDYVDSRGEPGYFQLDYYVYDRAGVPCRVCGTPIRATRQGQRASYHCPRCQT